MRFLRESPPLTGTLGRVEREIAAALILFGLHTLRKNWDEPIGGTALALLLKAAFEANQGPVRSWLTNPFLKPDFPDLVEQGFATLTEADGYALTPAALERLAPHIQEPA